MASKETQAEVTDLTLLGGITGAMERPKGRESGPAGTDDISADEIRLPRLAIAQGLSPQITPGDGAYIEGLVLFDMFNDLTGQVYGKGPLTFVPVRRDVRRIEFKPRSEGGGLVDPNVPKNDPRTKWSEAEDGTRLPPAATEFVEFIILLLVKGKAPEPIVLSIKTTNKWNRKAADQLTTFIKLRNDDIYAGLYTVDTKSPAKNDKGTFGVPTCKNAGFIPTDTPAGAALYAHAKAFHESLAGKTVVVDREEEIDDSMAANSEM
jgi:hypothetical protein